MGVNPLKKKSCFISLKQLIQIRRGKYWYWYTDTANQKTILLLSILCFLALFPSVVFKSPSRNSCHGARAILWLWREWMVIWI